MTVSELIDELLWFELTDTVDYLNLQIGTGPVEWDLTKTRDGDFRKWTPELGGNYSKPAPARLGADAG